MEILSSPRSIARGWHRDDPVDYPSAKNEHPHPPLEHIAALVSVITSKSLAPGEGAISRASSNGWTKTQYSLRVRSRKGKKNTISSSSSHWLRIPTGTKLPERVGDWNTTYNKVGNCLS